MNHSSKLSRRLLAKHHERAVVDGEARYRPKTEEAPLLWRHTGVCRRCHRRAISAAVCRACGHDHWATP